ncbi:hypothetical protein BDW66DRAFT_29721 [Aspergillus desertorum]
MRGDHRRLIATLSPTVLEMVRANPIMYYLFGLFPRVVPLRAEGMSSFSFHNYRIPIRILYISWVCTCTLWLGQMTNKLSAYTGLLPLIFLIPASFISLTVIAERHKPSD